MKKIRRYFIMKKFLVCLFIISAVIFFTNSLSANNLKAAFVDSQDVADEHPVYKEKIKELERILKPQKDKLTQRQKELETLSQDLSANQLASDEVKNAKQRNLQRKSEEFQKMVADFQLEIQKKESEILPENLKKIILEEVMKAIETVAKRDGFNVVYEINKANIVYLESALNITDKVKEELQKIVGAKKK